MKNSNKNHQDFYDENDEIERQIDGGCMSVFCAIVIVVIAIIASLGANMLVDYLATLCNCN